jgi:hypothetical protein
MILLLKKLPSAFKDFLALHSVAAVNTRRSY